MATRIGSIFADFTARTAGFQQGLEQIQAGMKKTNRVVADNTASIKAGFSSLTKMVGGIGIGLVVQKVLVGLRAVGEELSNIKDGALEMGTSVHEFQLLEMAAQYSSTAMSAMTSGMNKLEASLQEAARDGGTAAKKFDDLGINWKKLLEMSVAERFVYIAQSIDNLSTSSAEYSKWASILGEKNMPKLREAAMNAKGGIEALSAELKKTGEVTDNQLKQYDQAINKLQQWKRALVVTVVSMVDMEQGQRRVMESTAIMNGKLSELYSKVPDIAKRIQLLTDAWENYSGKKPETLVSEYNKVLSELTVELNKVTAAQKDQSDAQKQALVTIGETKDAIASLAKKYGDTSSYLYSLMSLSETSLGKGAEAARLIQAAISAARDSIAADTSKMADSLLTPYEKYLKMEAELQKRVGLNIPGAEAVLKAFRQTNPVIKETTDSIKSFELELSKIDAESAYSLKLREINDLVKEWSANAAIGADRANALGEAMRKSAYESQPDVKKSAEWSEYLQTPAQKKQTAIKKVQDNSAMTDENKKKAIYDINTGFVQMQQELVEQSQQLQSNTDVWTGLRDAAAEAEAAYNSATTIEQLNQTKNALDDVQEQYEFMGEVGQRAVESLSAGFARLIVEGGSVKDMLMGVVQMIAEMMLQHAMLSAFRSVGVAGWFAGGGDVDPNKYYVVGERGPELFSPKARGTIINETQMNARSSGGGSAPVIQFNLSAYDTQGMSQMIDSKTPSIIAQAMRTWKYENSRGKM